MIVLTPVTTTAKTAAFGAIYIVSKNIYCLGYLFLGKSYVKRMQRSCSGPQTPEIPTR